ncbi:MAG: FAD-dependent oxidoreductase [Anaerolineales bacterium]|nr:FAD-dependent oxidoreductase [Anaerolineales bacterium]
MQRDLAALVTKEYDLLVIGGGIYGSFIAWDASLRGLSVALVEKGDFGHATSSNSLKIIHGGLRYLQDANPVLVRNMIRERTVFMRIAPHLVHPLPFLLPTHGHGVRSKEVMTVALGLNDLLGFDRNQLGDPQKYIPNGRIISKGECLQILPGIADRASLTGGSVWYDAQIYNSEQLCLSVLQSADYEGAVLANYLEVINLVMKRDRVVGVLAVDTFSGQELEIRAKLVINATGPWVDRVLSLLNRSHVRRRFYASLAMNLITDQIVHEYAAGINTYPVHMELANPIARYTPTIFIVPWRRFSLVGTAHAPYDGQSTKPRVSEEYIQSFIDLVNTAYPTARLTIDGVRFKHQGLLPITHNGSKTDRFRLLRQGKIFDHQVEDDIEGLISVMGVKYTSARFIAEKVLDLVLRKLNREMIPCQTHKKPIYGGDIERFNDFIMSENANMPGGVEAKDVEHLIRMYGSNYRQVLRYMNEDTNPRIENTTPSELLRAEILYAIREAMAQKLSDVILRRTDLGAAGKPVEDSLHSVAAVMASELDWDQGKKDQEIKEVESIYTDCIL